MLNSYSYMKDWAARLTKRDKKHIMYIALHPEF